MKTIPIAIIGVILIFTIRYRWNKSHARIPNGEYEVVSSTFIGDKPVCDLKSTSTHIEYSGIEMPSGTPLYKSGQKISFTTVEE
jgi:hypothetical protein